MPTAQEKGKRPRTETDDAEEEGGEPIDPAILLSIEKLQEIQDEIYKINEEADNQVLEVEKKYSDVRRLVYVRRNEVIRKIPDFWLTAFLSHPTLGELLTEDDQQIFKHLESIDVDESDDIKLTCSITLDIVSGKTCMRGWKRRLLVDESFFTWFSDKKNSQLAHGEMDEVADIIKEDLWPNPLKFFNNESEDEFEEGDEDGAADVGSDEEEDRDDLGEEG